MSDVLFAWTVGIIIAVMAFILLQAVLVSCMAMLTNDNTFDSDYARFTTKAWLPAMNDRGPAKLNYARNAPGLHKQHFDDYQIEHNEYTKKHNEGISFRKYLKVKPGTDHQ